MKISFSLFAFLLLLIIPAPSKAESWRGLTLAPENRCSEYDRERDYTYSQSLEDKIVASMGGRIYSPYTGRTFARDTQTDIEHIVATSEAHDSGLCAASAQTRRLFANDLLNLTLASPRVNRCSSKGKCGKDAAEWLPERNKCWFAHRVIKVRQKYGLTIDRAEAQALDAALAGCETTDMIFYEDRKSINPEANDSSEPEVKGNVLLLTTTETAV